MTVMNAAQLIELLEEVYPHAHPERYRIEVLEDARLVFRYTTRPEDLRPGDTVSGPTMMTLADVGMYLAVLSMIGPVPHAVTTSLNINFLRKPTAGELVVETNLLKLGKSLAVGEVYVRREGQREPLAHATLTYSIPPTHR